MQHTPHAELLPATAQDDSIDLLDLLLTLRARWRLLVGIPVAVAVLAFGVTYLIPPTYTSQTVFMPPQQQSQSMASSALESLGAMAGLSGGGGGLKSPADQYAALLSTRAVTDQLIDGFKLMAVYDKKRRSDTREKLADNTRILVGKKDGLITVEVDDTSPQRAADMANAYIDSLRKLSDRLAIGEAQQRRVFFEEQLKLAQAGLIAAQQALQKSGFTQGALRTEPKAAAERYAKLQADVAAAQIKLEVMRRSLLDTTPEVQSQRALVDGLREQLAKAELPLGDDKSDDYVSKYRNFKYQETLATMLARQYETARVDEAREGALVQVVDRAVPAEWKSKPKRAAIAILAAIAAFGLLTVWLSARRVWQRAGERRADAAALSA
jgi:uncharacterized protein involved in exopolysaccharide biosynthesis